MQVKDKPKSGGFFKKAAIFKHYSPVQIQRIMIKVRILLVEERKKIDSELKYYVKLLYTNNNTAQQYLCLQEVCLKLLQIKANKIILQYIQKVIENKNIISDADGSVYNMEHQALWLQIIAWYLNFKKLSTRQQYSSFCLEFFKGVNILQDPSLENRLNQEIKGIKSKLNQIRFITVKDWIDSILQQFPKNTLAQYFQLNQLFLSNGFTNTQIKEYFSNQSHQQLAFQPIRSNLIPNGDYQDYNTNQKSFNNNYHQLRNSSSEVKENKMGDAVSHTKESIAEISLEEKYSVLLIKQSLEMFSTQEKHMVIRVAVKGYGQ